MSKDFAPVNHLLAHQMWVQTGTQSPYLSNMIFHFSDGTEKLMFTEKELEDRRLHEALAIMCSDIYDTLKANLSVEEFEKVNNLLNNLKDKFISGQSIEDFPEPILTWFFNKHNHYYHEPNDEEFVEYIFKNYRELNFSAKIKEE